MEITTNLWIRVEVLGEDVYINTGNVDLIFPETKRVVMRDRSITLDKAEDITMILRNLGFNMGE